MQGAFNHFLNYQGLLHLKSRCFLGFYFSGIKKHESYGETLKVLSEAKLTTDIFFKNVIVNDENSDIKKNRLELLQMFCKTYNNFIDFSKVEGV